MGEGDKHKHLRAVPAGTKPPATKPLPVKPASAKIGSPGSAKPVAPAVIIPSQLPVTSRTATLDDPLTTSLLAEVARRSRTIEVSPEQIDEANDLAAEHEAAPSADTDPDQ